MSGESTGGYKSGADMWADYKAHYGLIPVHIICTRYLDMMSRSADPEERRFCGELSGAMAAEPNFKDRPYYRHSFNDARLYNEETLFRDSDEANVKCAGEIEAAVNACRYQDGSYKLEPAVRAISDRHNTERVGYILAAEVRRNPRAFSEDNRKWARDFDIQTGFVSLWRGVRSDVLDGFVTGFREFADRNRAGELSAPGSEAAAVSFYTDGADYWRDLTLTSRSLTDALFAGVKNLETAMRRECSADDRRFCRELFGAMYEAEAARTNPAKFVYPYDAQTAGQRSETAYFQTSAKRNSECARAIDTAIHLSRYGQNQYNHALAAMKVVHDFGFARVNLVLAHNVQQGMDAGAFSADSRRWADGLQTYGEGFAGAMLDTHPSLTDKFIRQTRLLYGELNADRFMLPGQPESAEDVHGYDVVRGITFDDGSGFVVGMNPDAPADFACWRFKEENGAREYFEGNYVDRLGDAAADYTARVIVHMDGGAKELQKPPAAETPAPDTADSLNAKLRKAAEYIISTGAAETTSCNYSVHMSDVPDDILPQKLLMEHIQTIADLTQEYESVSDAYVTDGFIDVNFYLAYCPNYEPQAEERDEYPPAREILDPLTNKPLARETGTTTDSPELNESEQNFAAWMTVTDSSRYKWVEDEIYRLNGRGAMYYTGGEDGVYIRIGKDGKLEAGSYEGAVPHIGEAMFKPAVTKQYDNYSAAFTAAIEAGGKRFLADMFSGSEPQPLFETNRGKAPEEKPSVLKRIREASAAPKAPRKEKTPGQRKNRDGEEL